MSEPKASSKTLVTALVSFIIIALQTLEIVPGVDWAAYEALFVCVLMFVMRLVTNEPVSLADFLTQLGGLLKKESQNE